MAISVNKVYQTVLAIANKEQRGYVTPQEFNLFAEQAQLDIVQQYFYDLNQFKRNPGNKSKTADVDTILEEKITYLRKTRNLTISSNGSFNPHPGTTIDGGDLYKIDILNVKYTYTDRIIENIAEECSFEEYNLLSKSPLTRATVNNPKYVMREAITDHLQPLTGSIRGRIYPSIDDLVIDSPYLVPTGCHGVMTYIQKPPKPNWTYIMVNNKALYNVSANDHQDFVIHPADQQHLIVKILQLAGVSIREPEILQVAAQEENKKIQQQKS